MAIKLPEKASILKSLRYLIFNTRVEIVAGLFAIGTLTGVLSYRDNQKKAAHIPLAFSEIETITKKFNQKGEPVPALTKEYAVINDFTMKVFESSNDALAKNTDNEAFARELQKHMDHTIDGQNTISDYAAQFPSITKEALASLSVPVQAAKELPAILKKFDDSWDESHRDHYHTEWYTTLSCSGSGKSRSCHTVLRSRQVYDNTTHTYTFHPDEAAQAQRLLAAFIKKYPEVNISQLVKTTQTNEANQRAIRTSMADLFEDKNPTAEDYLKLANTWATASNFTEYFPEVRESHDKLKKLSNVWGWSLQNAHSESYKTRSRRDAGPEEFRTAEAIIRHGMTLGRATKDITSGIHYADQAVPKLNQKINEFIDMSLNSKPGDADELRASIMDMSRDMYKKNFEKGFDVYPFKWETVILLTLAGMAIGAGAGAGVDHMLNRYESKRLVTEAEEKKKKPKFHL